MILADGTKAYVGQRVTRKAEDIGKNYYAYWLGEGEITSISDEKLCIVHFLSATEGAYEGGDYWCDNFNLVALEPKIEFDEAEFLSLLS